MMGDASLLFLCLMVTGVIGVLGLVLWGILSGNDLD